MTRRRTLVAVLVLAASAVLVLLVTLWPGRGEHVVDLPGVVVETTPAPSASHPSASPGSDDGAPGPSAAPLDPSAPPPSGPWPERPVPVTRQPVAPEVVAPEIAVPAPPPAPPAAPEVHVGQGVCELDDDGWECDDD